tara:strand:- start:1352 stop:2029 length:678 start_codon:yes stop_codon:yes gene_type:complete
MNDLEDYFYNKPKTYPLRKWVHYFHAYDKHFSRFRGKSPVVMEIGVDHGGSLEMWKDYFGEGCKIYGVDANPRCQTIDLPDVQIFIGDQENPALWEEIKKVVPKVDILIDDGGHTMGQQKVTFVQMYDHIKSDGVYLCEDTHTSYRPAYGGGYKNNNSFIEYSKNFVDMLNAYHIDGYAPGDEPFGKVGDYLPFRRTTESLHYYDSIIVLEKKEDNEIPYHTLEG